MLGSAFLTLRLPFDFIRLKNLKIPTRKLKSTLFGPRRRSPSTTPYTWPRPEVSALRLPMLPSSPTSSKKLPGGRAGRLDFKDYVPEGQQHKKSSPLSKIRANSSGHLAAPLQVKPAPTGRSKFSTPCDAPAAGDQAGKRQRRVAARPHRPSLR